MNLRAYGLVGFLLAHTFVEGNQDNVHKLQKEIDTPRNHQITRRLKGPKAPANGVSDLPHGGPALQRKLQETFFGVFGVTWAGAGPGPDPDPIYHLDTLAGGQVQEYFELVLEDEDKRIDNVLKLSREQVFVTGILDGGRVIVESISQTEPTEAPTITPAPTDAPVTPAPTDRPTITPAPTDPPVTPAPTDPPVTPAPMDAPTITPAPTDAPVTLAPTDAPVTPAPTDAPAPVGSRQLQANPIRALTVLCKFSGIAAEPHDQNYYQNMMNEEDLYYREASYGSLSLTNTVLDWGDMAGTRASYIIVATNTLRPNAEDTLLQDCLDVADANVDFSTNMFQLVNLVFNADLEGRSFASPTRAFTRDGATQTVGVTWMASPNSDDHDYLGHEIGHAIGLPHCSGPYGVDYDSKWGVMSSSSVGDLPADWTCTVAERDPDFGCFAVHPIGWHKDILGFIPAGQRANPTDTDNNQIVDLERLALPAGNGNLYTLIEILNTGTDFYTVECRARVGQYDGTVPANAVVIHRLDTTRTGAPGDAPAQVVDNTPADMDPNGAGGQWLPGETMIGEGGLSIRVCSVTPTGCRVNVNPVNRAPVAQCQDVTRDADPVTGTYVVLLSDVNNGSFDPDSDCLDNPTVELIVPGANPALPPGMTTVTVRITDLNGLADVCNAVVTVNTVNEAPVAVNDVASTNQNQAVVIDILANDNDPNGNPLTVTSCTNPANGAAAIIGGTVTYTPNTNFFGTDSFFCTVCDPEPLCDTGLVTVEVNGAPVAVDDTATTNKNTAVVIAILANDNDPDGDPLTVASCTDPANGAAAIIGSTVTYTPVTNFDGSDSFTCTVCDPKPLCDTGLVSVVVNNPLDFAGILALIASVILGIIGAIFGGIFIFGSSDSADGKVEGKVEDDEVGGGGRFRDLVF